MIQLQIQTIAKERLQIKPHKEQTTASHQIAAMSPATAIPSPSPLSILSLRAPALGVEEAEAEASEALALEPVAEAEDPLDVVAALEPPVDVAVEEDPAVLEPTGVLCAPGAQVADEGRSAL